MNSVSSCWVVIPAAGSGKRMGTEVPKQYMELNDMTMLEHSVSSLLYDQRILGIKIAVDLEQELHVDLPRLKNPKVSFVQGGTERSDSVLAGLNAVLNIANEADWVLVHDAARPCVTVSEISQLIDIVSESGIGGVLAQKITDTVKRTDSNGLVNETVQRECLWRAFTPQMFPIGLLRKSLLSAKAANISVTDEAAAMERMGHPVQLIPGFSTNIKVTVPADFEFARTFLDHVKTNCVSLSELEK